MTTIQTERLLLRPMRPDDLEDLFAVFGNADAMRYWSTPPHPDRTHTADLIQATVDADPATTAEFAIEWQGKVIGKAALWQMPEIGYIIHPDYWRRGFAREALIALIAYGFEKRMMDKITADVDPDNLASVRLLQDLGFAETGRAEKTLRIGDAWFDSIYFALQKEGME